MKKFLILSLIFTFFACQQKSDSSKNENKIDTTSIQETDSIQIETSKTDTISSSKIPKLNKETAEELAKLPLDCVQMEYPNKLDHVISSEADLDNPKKLHPAFYGCFDWHSSVHAHWSLVRLLKKYPDLEQAEEIKTKLLENLSKANIDKEVAYFGSSSNRASERTYGWAWLLKLAEEIHTWDAEEARIMEKNLQPLTNLMIKNFESFLPKLTKPIRVGEHQNTAFALVFVYDYAEKTENKDLKNLVKFWAKSYYLHDEKCPITYEPGGFDFLSPCLEEIDIMQRILDEKDFKSWLKDFMPQLYKTDFELRIGKVSDREDGKLVHLDGVNFSRAWVLYGLANKYEELSHLRNLADRHLESSFKNIFDGDSYMGSHWLGSFALYALEKQNN